MQSNPNIHVLRGAPLAVRGNIIINRSFSFAPSEPRRSHKGREA